MNKYTPGPWVAKHALVYGAGFVVHQPNTSTMGPLTTEWEPNARLIAAAPELLETVEWFCLNVMGTPMDKLHTKIVETRLLIEKAKGNV